MTDTWKAITEELATYLSSNLASLSLVSCAVDKGVAPHPRYPANPVAMLPAVFVRAYTSEVEALTNQGAKWQQSVSVWYYRKQTASQNHQQLLMADLKTIHEVLLQDYCPTALGSAGAEFVQATEIVVHDEISHPMGEPRLRVSVGEILLKITARSHN